MCRLVFCPQTWRLQDEMRSRLHDVTEARKKEKRKKQSEALTQVNSAGVKGLTGVVT